MPRTVIATDNGALTGGNWTQLNTDWSSVTGGTVFAASASNGSNEGAAVWSGTGSFTDAQYAKITIGGLAFLNSAHAIGVIVRASTDTNAARDFYFAYVAADTAAPNYTPVLGKVVNGTRTVLHSATVAWANGNTLSLEVDGTTLTVFKNDVALGGSFIQTDASLSTGKPGICANGPAPTGDDWEGGNITAGGGSIGLEDPVWLSLEQQTNPIIVTVY